LRKEEIGLSQRAAALRIYQSRRDALVDYAASLLGDHARAEDIVQDAWLRLEMQPETADIRDADAYLRRIVRNLAIDALRRSARQQRVAGGDMELAERTVEDEAPSAEQTLIARQVHDRIMQCLAGLPERQRVAIEMHRIAGCRLRDIAEHLGVSIPYVHSLIARGLAACDAARDEEA